MTQATLDNEICIIGAGPSGIAAGKQLKECGVRFRIVESADNTGGAWYISGSSSRVYASTRLITSKAVTEYTDYPMPSHWPDYLDHKRALEYLRSYVKHFGLNEHIDLKASVVSVSQRDDGSWDVCLSSGEHRRYGGIIVATGHLHAPRYPAYPGTFNGVVLHSADYRGSDDLHGRRVLVIGGGNAGCDIAVDAAQTAERTVHSTRHRYLCMPKYFMGRPVDQLEEGILRLHVPSVWSRVSDLLIWRIAVGDVVRDVRYERGRTSIMFMLRDLAAFEDRIVFNDLLPHYVRHGDIITKPDVAAYDGPAVVFTDGTREIIDTIVCATGYRVAFPFLSKVSVRSVGGYPQLFLHIFPEEFSTLFFIGLANPNGSLWRIAESQARLITAYIVARAVRPDRARRLDDLKRRYLRAGRASDAHPVRSLRGHLEVERYGYQRQLQRLAGRLKG